MSFKPFLKTQQKITRHSARVRMLRFIMPASALILSGVVLHYALENNNAGYLRIATAEASTTESSLRMLNPRYIGVDDNKQPFSISAKVASQADKDTADIQLDAVEAEVTLEGGERAIVRAKQAHFDSTGQKIILSGNVGFADTRGYQLLTDDLTVDITTGQAVSNVPVQGVSPMGTVNAKGMRILEKGKHIVFDGRSTIHLPAE